MRLFVSVIALLCVPLSGCIIADAVDGAYMLTHGGRHIDEAPVTAAGGDMAGSVGNLLGGMGPTGGKKNASKDATTVGQLLGNLGPDGGKATGAGTAALTAPAPANVGELLGKSMPPPPNGEVGKFLGDQMTLRPPATRPGLTDGTVPGYGPDSPASAGQVISALGLASSITNPGGLLAGAASEDSTNRTLLGRTVDDAFGGKPGTPVATRNPIANNTNARGDVIQGDDTRLADRASGAATAALTGDAPTIGAGTDALFSDIGLLDRRKPRSNGAGTNMLLAA